MAETLTESFCERCGTRYEFKAPTRLNPLRKTRGMLGGLKNYLTSQDALSDAVGDAMRAEQGALASAQLAAFHESFNFCIDCRQYTCVNCWNDEAGRCRTCAPIAGTDDLVERMSGTFGASQTPVADGAMAEDDLQRRLGLDIWPTVDLPTAASTNGHTAIPDWPASDQISGGFEAAPGPEPEPEPIVFEAAPEAEPEPEPIVFEAAPEAEPEPVVFEAAPEPEPEPMVFEAAPEPEPEPVDLTRVAAWEADGAYDIVFEAAPEPEPEPVVFEAEPEPEPEPVVFEAEPEPEPEPVVFEAAPEPEPEPVVFEAAPEPEPIQPAPAPKPRIGPSVAPINETILRFPERPIQQPEVSPAPHAPEPALAAEDDSPELAARRAQLDMLGLGDPGQGPVRPQQRTVLPYRSRGAAIPQGELAARAAAQGIAFWEASAREVAEAGAATVGVQNCGGCGLSLSATARFCRRCGSPQSRSA